MIKKFLLAAMLIWCATEGMAQSEKVLENARYKHNNSNDYFYALYSDRTAILIDVTTTCSNTYEIPVIITVGSNEYKVTEVAEKAFENIGIPSNDNIEVKIYGTDIKLCADPFGSNLPTDKGTTTNLHASPCLDVSIWNSYFTDVYKDLIPNVEDFFPCEIEYNSGGDYILQPFDINTDFSGLYTGFSGETYTLNVTKSKITSIDIETQFVNPSDIAYNISVEKALLKNSAGKVCEELDYTGGPYDIADAVIVKEGEIREIKEKNVLVCTDLKFYPTPGSSPSSGELSIVSNVMSGSHPDRPSDKTLEEWLTMGDISNDYVALTNQVVVLADDFKRDTIALPCTAVFVIDGNQISLKITIAKDAEGVGTYGDPQTHYQTNNYKPKLNLSQNAEFLFSLKGTYPVFVNKYKYKDPANNIDGHLEDISETSGSGLKEFTKTFFRVDEMAYRNGLFIDYSEPNLTKTYNNSETMDIPDDKTPVMMKKRRFNPASYGTGKVDNVFMSKLNYDENVEIEADYTLKFADPYVGTNKEITLTIIPRDPFYRALLGDNNTVTLKGTITPMQLSETDIAEIEKLIKSALEPTKIVDGTSDINCSKKELTYDETEKYKVNVTINEAKYLKSEKEVSTPGSGYDMKVTYEVDHNFCFGSTQTGYEYQKSVIFNNEGEIRQTPSVSNDDFATAFKAKYKNYLSKTYDGTTNFLGFDPQDDVLSVTVGSATDAVAAQIKITSVAYDEKDAGTRSLKVECTPVQGSPYTISSPVTITGDDIKITPFVLDNIADYVKEDEHFKKDKTYNGYHDVEMNNPAFTIPGVTVNGTRETVDGGTIADAIYTKDGAEVSAVGDDYTITATLSIRVDRNYCLGIDNSGNYIYGNTYNIGTGSITPAKLDITFTPEDLDGKVSLTRKYNSEDASADILQSTITKNDHTFEITSAIFTDNTPGTNKEIDITIKLKDNNPNYTFDPTTVTITGGTIEKNNDEPEKIVIDSKSIKQSNDNRRDYCIKGINGLDLKFTKISGNIESFKITIDGDEKLSEIMSTGGVRKGDTVIYVNIPSDIKPGEYKGTIQFFGEDEKYASDPYDFTITVNMPPSLVNYLYHNVIFVDNHDTLFTEYQWYKNGEKIEGATRQYYYEKTLDGEYYVACKHNSGISLHSCPVKGEVSTKVSISSVKVYPNPTKANIPFNLELVGGNGNYAGAEMLIYNNSGNLVKHITNITDIITLTLPQGNYSGALFFNGEKTGFKIIVK